MNSSQILTVIAVLALLLGFMLGQVWRNRARQPDLVPSSTPPAVHAAPEASPKELMSEEERQQRLARALENLDFKRVHDDVLKGGPFETPREDVPAPLSPSPETKE